MLGQLKRLSDTVLPLSVAVALHADTTDMKAKTELSAMGSFAELYNNLGVGILKAADVVGGPLPYEVVARAFNRGVVRERAS